MKRYANQNTKYVISIKPKNKSLYKNLCSSQNVFHVSLRIDLSKIICACWLSSTSDLIFLFQICNGKRLPFFSFFSWSNVYAVKIKSLNLCSKILIYAVLSRGKFCREFTHFFGVLFLGQKICWRTKNDYYEVCKSGQSLTNLDNF